MIPSLLSAALLLVASTVDAQSVGADGCLRLLGSVACPAFQYAYIHPSNLSNAWPWLAGVTTVAQFDVAALNYFVNPFQFQQTKFVNQLGCSNASGVTIQYSRSRLCSNWVNSQWGRGCTANYNGTSAATSQKMICQSTCLQYSASARNIVNSTACPGPDTTNGGREATLLKDYVDCTDWMTLATNDTATCILGESNEGNCGFGTSTSQLCDYCRGGTPDACCYNSNTDVSVCGYTLPARPSTSSSISPSASSGPTSAAAAGAGTGNGTPLSNGQLAGAIVGAVLGALLLLALLILLLCMRRRKRDRANPRHSTASSFAPGAASTPGAFSSMFSANSPQPNSSEKGLIGNSRMAGVSSPTVGGGETLYGSGYNKSVESGGLLNGNGNGHSVGPSPSPGLMSGLGIAAGAGAGAGALAGAAAGAGGGGGNTAGMRTSGIVLPRVRDENQGSDKWIETGAEVTVLWPYTATLPDELDLRPGMKIKVLRLYDDAWGTGVVVDGSGSDAGRQGAFPVVCVSEGSSLGSSGGSRSSTASH